MKSHTWSEERNRAPSQGFWLQTKAKATHGVSKSEGNGDGGNYTEINGTDRAAELESEAGKQINEQNQQESD